MSNAGVALRQAKELGRHRYEFFSAQLNETAQRRLDFGADLRKAFGRDELEVAYELRVEVGTGRITGAQSLARWKHPSGRVIEGDALLALAGTSDMGLALAEWMLHQVADHVAKWRAARLQPLPVAAKLSLAHVTPAEIPKLLRRTGADKLARLLGLDLQQAGAIEGVAAADIRAIGLVRDMGVRVALDRFGAGHSSLAQLRKLPLDEVKLDASLMEDVETDKGAALVLGLADLARRMGLNCIALGIDRPGQLAFLKRHQWREAQGRVFGEPYSGIDFAVRCLPRAG
jgi:EAL domain-containing protein (putative c-di-GMP-specific phosphodiesterase class I)